jgi:hypothetical protein
LKRKRRKQQLSDKPQTNSGYFDIGLQVAELPNFLSDHQQRSCWFFDLMSALPLQNVLFSPLTRNIDWLFVSLRSLKQSLFL